MRPLEVAMHTADVSSDIFYITIRLGLASLGIEQQFALSDDGASSFVHIGGVRLFHRHTKPLLLLLSPPRVPGEQCFEA